MGGFTNRRRGLSYNLPEVLSEEDEEAGRKAGRKTRRGGRKGVPKKLITKDNGLRVLLVLILKQLAKVSLHTREIRGALLDTLMIHRHLRRPLSG